MLNIFGQRLNISKSTIYKKSNVLKICSVEDSRNRETSNGKTIMFPYLLKREDLSSNEEMISEEMIN